LRVLKEKILPIFLKLNFTPNTLGGYGLTYSKTDVHFTDFNGIFSSTLKTVNSKVAKLKTKTIPYQNLTYAA